MKNLEFFNRNQARDFINKNKPMAIIPTGSVEQHLNHLFIGMDINSATRIAQDLAEKFSDDVIFYRPLNAGIAEHHMAFPGTMTLRVNTFIGVLTDIVESLIRGGVKKILFINGHGGNVEPMATAMVWTCIQVSVCITSWSSGTLAWAKMNLNLYLILS